MTLTLFCTPAHFNKHNVTFIKLGTNDVNMMTSWRYCFPRYYFFGCFSLKETENLLIFWCKIKTYFTRDHRKSYYMKILLSMITCEINFYLTPTFNKYPLYIYSNLYKYSPWFPRLQWPGTVERSTSPTMAGSASPPTRTRRCWNSVMSW